MVAASKVKGNRPELMTPRSVGFYDEVAAEGQAIMKLGLNKFSSVSSSFTDKKKVAG